MTDVVKITKKDSDFNTFLYDNSVCQQQKSIMVGEGIFAFNEELKTAMDRNYDAFILSRWYIQSYEHLLKKDVSDRLFNYIFSRVDFERCTKKVIYQFFQLAPYKCFKLQKLSEMDPTHLKWLRTISQRIYHDTKLDYLSENMLKDTQFCYSLATILSNLIASDEYDSISNLTKRYLYIFFLDNGLDSYNCLFSMNYEVVIKNIIRRLRDKYFGSKVYSFVNNYVFHFIEANVMRLYQKTPVDLEGNAAIINKYFELLNEQEQEKINSIRNFYELKYS